MIENNIPIPKERANKIKYPFADLKVGDSFFVETNLKYIQKVQSTIHGIASYFKREKNLPDYRIATRKESTGVRVWRIQ